MCHALYNLFSLITTQDLFPQNTYCSFHLTRLLSPLFSPQIFHSAPWNSCFIVNRFIYVLECIFEYTSFPLSWKNVDLPQGIMLPRDLSKTRCSFLPSHMLQRWWEIAQSSHSALPFQIENLPSLCEKSLLKEVICLYCSFLPILFANIHSSSLFH